MDRRQFVLSALAAGVAGAGWQSDALAFDAVKVMIPAGPGGGFDQVGRNLGATLTAAGQVKNVQYENKGGAGGAIGLAQFINTAKGDPNALFISGLVTVGSTILNKSAVTLANVTPIARLVSEAEVLVVPAASKIQTMKDFVDALKANPGAVAVSGGSAGGTDHILLGLIAKEAGVDPSKVNYIPYTSGSEAVAQVLGGHVAGGISGLGEFLQQIKAGRVRALAVSSAERIPDANTIPTLKEQGINVELVNWRGVFAAPGITDAQRQDWIKAVEAAVKSDAWKKVLDKLEWTPYYLPGDGFKAFVDGEMKRIGGVIESLGLIKK